MTRWQIYSRPLNRKPTSQHKINASPPLILLLGFMGLIVVGALLLKLPVATTTPISWLQSAFTATSAVTVTGLIVVDTGTAFTAFGQIVIAVLIQLGGLGLMTFAVVTLIALGGKVSFLQQSTMKEAFNQTDASTLVSTAKSVLIFAFITESVGILILTLHWCSDMGLSSALYNAFFYTISAFNNAGFALHSDSLMQYVDDPVVNLVITGLFIVGGLGFSVWIDLVRKRAWQTLTVYSKVMIVGTCAINMVALILIYLIESDNAETLGSLSEAGKWWAAWFQAVTPRTAGFNTINTAALEDASTALTMLLMFIGGGSMSTASGIKLVTFVVLLVATYSFLRRDPAPTLFHHTIKQETILKALALTMISLGACCLAIFLLLLSENAQFLDIVFEAVSALGTVGLSRGLTGELSIPGQCIIIFLMLVGRLGPLTLAYFLASPRQRRIRYVNCRLAIG